MAVILAAARYASETAQDDNLEETQSGEVTQHRVRTSYP